MTIEIRMLAWAIVLGLVHVFATGQLTVAQFGMKYGLSPRDERRELTGVGARVQRAFTNYMQTFPFFAAAVLAIQVLNRHTATSALGAELYLAARVIYVPLYAAGIPVVRTIAYLVGVAGIVMVLTALT